MKNLPVNRFIFKLFRQKAAERKDRKCGGTSGRNHIFPVRAARAACPAFVLARVRARRKGEAPPRGPDGPRTPAVRPVYGRKGHFCSLRASLCKGRRRLFRRKGRGQGEKIPAETVAAAGADAVSALVLREILYAQTG